MCLRLHSTRQGVSPGQAESARFLGNCGANVEKTENESSNVPLSTLYRILLLDTHPPRSAGNIHVPNPSILIHLAKQVLAIDQSASVRRPDSTAAWPYHVYPANWGMRQYSRCSRNLSTSISRITDTSLIYTCSVPQFTKSCF